MNCRENRYIVVYPTPPHYPTGGGGGVRSQNWRDGWEEGTDGREGWDVMAIMKLTQCIWHGMGA